VVVLVGIAENNIIPVGIDHTAVRTRIQESDVRGAAGISVLLIVDFNKLLSIEQREKPGCLSNAYIGVVGKFSLAAFSFFSGDEDYPVGGPGSVDSRCSTIFKDFKRFDIRRVNIPQGVGWCKTTGITTEYRYTIQYDERAGTGRNRVNPTNTDLWWSTQDATGWGNLNTRSATSELAFKAGCSQVSDSITLNLRNGTGNIAFLLSTVTDHDHFSHGNHV